MSAIATLLAEMGHAVSGHDPADDTPFLAAARAPSGVAVDDRRARARCPPVDAVVVSTATPADHPHVVAAPRRGHAGACTGPRRSPRICAGRRTVAVAGTHGKTTTSALLATLLAAAGLEPGLRRRRRGRRPGPQRGLGRRRARSSSRPTRATAPSSPSAPASAIVTNVEPDHLEHWGGEAAAARRVRAVRGRAWTGRPCSAPTIPGPPALAAHAAEPVTYGTAAGADYRIADVATEGTGVRFTLEHAGERGRRRRAGGARACTTPATRPPRWRWPTASASTSPTAAAGPRPASGAWPAASRCGARRRAWCWWTATTTCPPRWRRRWRPPGPGTGAGSCAASSRIATAAPRRSGRSFADCFADADLLVVTGDLPGRGGAPARGHRQDRGRRRARRPPVEARGLAARPSTTSWPTSAARCAPATSASPSAPATSPRSRPGAARGCEGAGR